MALPADQQHALSAIARELSTTDPQLAAEFDAFSGGLSCPAGPWPLPPPQPPRPRGARRWWRPLRPWPGLGRRG